MPQAVREPRLTKEHALLFLDTVEPKVVLTQRDPAPNGPGFVGAWLNLADDARLAGLFPWVANNGEGVIVMGSDLVFGAEVRALEPAENDARPEVTHARPWRSRRGDSHARVSY